MNDLFETIWISAFFIMLGFVIGRDRRWDEIQAEAQPSTDEDELLRALGLGVYKHAKDVWFDMSMVGEGFTCTRERKLRVRGKPDLTITISGGTDQ